MSKKQKEAKLSPSGKARYVNFFTDFGFKRLFGSEPSKVFLLDFLNELLQQQEGKIKSIKYLKNEQLGRAKHDRSAVYDLYCETENGNKFIVELQKSGHEFFKDRTLYYSTFPIIEQAKKGEWDYKLQPVYVVAILGFVFDEDKNDPKKFRYDVKLSDVETGKVFYDKLTFIYLEMPKFTKTEKELTTNFDKWLYAIRNLDLLDEIPACIRSGIFEDFFEMAEIANLNKQEIVQYEDSLKVYRDWYSVLKSAVKDSKKQGHAEGHAKGLAKGLAKGKAEANRETAIKMLSMKLSLEVIEQATGISVAELRTLRKS
ncbi:MAG: Rpn family recombination-promoting nuclease/putative transposase [Thermoguttaceae bacterium]